MILGYQSKLDLIIQTSRGRSTPATSPGRPFSGLFLSILLANGLSRSLPGFLPANGPGRPFPGLLLSALLANGPGRLLSTLLANSLAPSWMFLIILLFPLGAGSNL